MQREMQFSGHERQFYIYASFDANTIPELFYFGSKKSLNLYLLQKNSEMDCCSFCSESVVYDW